MTSSASRMSTLARQARACAALLFLLTSAPALAHEHMALGSTQPGGGDLALDWDFEDDAIETFEAFCTTTACLYSNTDPAFLGIEEEEHDLYPLAEGTAISLEVIARDSAVTVRVDGNPLDPGKTVSLGTGPHIHSHPSWQLLLPPGAPQQEFTISYKLTTDSPLYGESPVYTSILTNAVDDSTPSPTATATATATPVAVSDCPGDCDGSGDVTVDEIVRGVNVALNGFTDPPCPALDSDDNGSVTVDDLVRAINTALNGCASPPTPTPEATPTVAVPSFARIQSEILTPRCAVPFCHSGSFLGGGLSLAEGISYGQLVGVEPSVAAAAAAGYLRVDAGRPDTSFLLLKLVGPPPAYGSRMPIGGALSEAQIELVRAWILGGAPR